MKRPILIGGLGLAASFWMFDVFRHSPLDNPLVLGAIAIGSGVWFWRGRSGKTPNFAESFPNSVDRPMVEEALAEVQALIDVLAAENAPDTPPSDSDALSTPEDVVSDPSDQLLPSPILKLQEQRLHLSQELDRQTLSLAVAGNKATGKTALIKHLQTVWTADQPRLSSIDEISGLLGDVDGEALSPEALSKVEAADLALFVVNGDLTDSEFQCLQTLAAAGQTFILIFNKQDQYIPLDRGLIAKRLESRLANLAVDAEVFAISTAPNPIKVRKHLPDGQVQEWMEQPDPETDCLTDKLTQVLQADTQPLVCATVLRQSRRLKQSVRKALNGMLRKRATPVIEQLQWVAAATAFANPLPSVDLLATAAINGQLVMDLGKIYGQKFSIDQAKAAAGTLAKVMVQLGLVELSTQALSAVLKSHAMTYAAGGFLQGVSAAYLTRLAGLTLIEYFEEQSLSGQAEGNANISLEGIGQKLQTIFQQTRQGSLLQSLVRQALGRLMPDAPTPPTLALPEGQGKPLQLTRQQPVKESVALEVQNTRN
ncbi:MAG: DUF697 domain-containing protein [Leptolyngbyaceae cyanobacterium MO_188.B28]|nr:DUF697 domain-containing protein [Leptolyngbyaceae cyanobacterium MO_188.B28]